MPQHLTVPSAHRAVGVILERLADHDGVMAITERAGGEAAQVMAGAA